jgi:23S rRNA (pseudouridine1915-N3)-methyltransferase
MQITLLATGKATDNYIVEGVNIYAARIKHYCKFVLVEIEAGKGDDTRIRKKEAETILKRVGEKDYLILLDENGRKMSSVVFSGQLRHHQNIATKNIVFVIGGAYGFSEEVYKRADMKMALSEMTFPHQLVRVIFLEQLYRAMTILKGEKYHH